MVSWAFRRLPKMSAILSAHVADQSDLGRALIVGELRKLGIEVAKSTHVNVTEHPTSADRPAGH